MTTQKKKNQAELEIEALADVFGIATTGFEEYYKSAKEKDKGNYSKSASSGDSSKSASSGDYSKSASSGNYSTAASSGYSSTAASSGYFSGCTSIGYRAAVKGDMGNLLMASEYIKQDNKYIPVGGKADIVDGKILKPGCWYIVEKSKWVQVDFTDGLFTYVLSNKKGVKKVKTDNGKILYIVSDENGNSAHGETIAKAQEDLIYKNVAKSDVVVPKKVTGKEWIPIYRAITGACAAGVKMFVERTGKNLDDAYTAKEVIELTKGQYGAEQFAKKAEGE